MVAIRKEAAGNEGVCCMRVRAADLLLQVASCYCCCIVYDVPYLWYDTIHAWCTSRFFCAPGVRKVIHFSKMKEVLLMLKYRKQTVLNNFHGNYCSYQSLPLSHSGARFVPIPRNGHISACIGLFMMILSV